MKEWLFLATEYAIVMIDSLALLVVVGGTVEAAIGSLRYLMSGESGHARRDVWLRYARWLVAALTLQLAADVIESAITTNWEAVGRLAAIALVRTFLNYFLGHKLIKVIPLGREI